MNPTNILVIIGALLLLMRARWQYKKYKQGYGFPILRFNQFKESYGLVPPKKVYKSEKAYLLFITIIIFILVPMLLILSVVLK